MRERAAGSEPPASARQQQQRREDARVELLVAARLGQLEAAAAARVELLEQRLAEQSAETAHIVLAAGATCWRSVLASTAASGKEQLLGALLKHRPPPAKIRSDSSGSNDTQAAVNPFHPLVQDLSAAFLAAADKGHPQCLRLLLEACASSSPTAVTELLQARDAWGDTPLLLATRHGHVECLRLLLEHSPEVQVAAVGNFNRTALMRAARFDRPACLQLLLEHSPEVQLAAVDEFGRTALMLASGCIFGGQGCMQLLLEHSPEMQVAAVDELGHNALMHAAGWGKVECLRLLLAHSPGAQVAAEGDGGACALAEAAGSASVDCLQLLLAQPHSQQQLDKALLKACGELAKLKKKATVSSTAVKQGALKQCVQLLLGKGAELDTGADKEISAVYWPISKELVARALVPDMANEAVLGLALAATALRKRHASGEEAAGPSKRAHPSS